VTREQTFVQLVDPAGVTIGATTVDEAHRAPGRLHRAFSVLLLDDRGRLLLQQRAAVKTRFALRWANACCGHPAPGESVPDAAARRTAQELGICGITLHEAGVYLYRATDQATGRVEHEYDHVLIGRVSAQAAFDPDPAEVAATEWVHPAQLTADLDLRPEVFAPWLRGVVAAWAAEGANGPGADPGVRQAAG
jgi:isopentenyl-diphosphate delta-isomerase